MDNFSAIELLLNFLVTWFVVLTPPVLIRAIRKKPILKGVAIGLCLFFYFANVVLFAALGSQSKSHAALLLGAWLSYYIFTWQRKSGSSQGDRKALGYDK